MNAMEMLARLNQAQSAASGPRPLPEAQIAELELLLAAYVAPCTFKPGDLVTPRPNGDLVNVGQPAIVLEIRQDCPHEFSGDMTKNSYGARLNVRIAMLNCGQLTTWWVEHHQLQPWTQP